jgi:hypothetical protein
MSSSFFFPWSGVQLTSYAEIPAPSSCPQRDRWVKLKVELLGNLLRELVLEKRSLECLEVMAAKAFIRDRARRESVGCTCEFAEIAPK